VVRLPAWRAPSRAATAALCAAYAERVGRPFPPGLLPDGPLHPVGRSLPARLRGVDLLFGSAATRRPLIPFSRAEFEQRAPIGNFERTMASDRSRLADPDFARLLEGAPS
jgi:hypothetical protein